MNSEKGVLLVNLGSPESPDPKDVKVYLREFLMDERVLDIPKWLRKFLLEVIILPKRPKKSAEAYAKIWWPEGSPLIVLSKRLQKLVQEKLDIPVALGMRYGKMSIEKGLDELVQKNPGIKTIKLVPLYPHYAMSSYETVVVKAEEIMAKKYRDVSMEVVKPFYNEPTYISSLAGTLGKYLDKEYDHILFSYHGIPERHVRKTDPSGEHCLKCENCCEVKNEAHAFCYRHQVFETTRLVAEKLNLDKKKYSVSFQSRLGRDPWLLPFTDKRLEELPKEGNKKLIVLCPAFVSDCLETLEEIGMEGKEEYLKAGGEEFTLVPCINEDENWVSALASYCK